MRRSRTSSVGTASRRHGARYARSHHAAVQGAFRPDLATANRAALQDLGHDRRRNAPHRQCARGNGVWISVSENNPFFPRSERDRGKQSGSQKNRSTRRDQETPLHWPARWKISPEAASPPNAITS